MRLLACRTGDDTVGAIEMLTAITIALAVGALLGTFIGWKLGRGWEKMTPRASARPLRPKIR
jgi:hypothetical protein